MARITFNWNQGHFSTDCEQIAEMFARSPESFNPSMRDRICPGVRDALRRLIEKQHALPPLAPSYSEEIVCGIRIRVETLKITLL